jgi:hypothetical protein
MRIAILAAGLLGAAACAASAQAQTAPAAAPAAPAPAPAAAAPAQGGFTDEDLKAFGSAMAEIQKINAEYGPKLASADAAAKADVQKEMIGKMGAAVQASGLSPDKYNAMSAAVQKDAALRQRLTDVLNAPPAA